MNQTIDFFEEHGVCLGDFEELLKVPEFAAKISTSLDMVVNATEPTPIYWSLGFDKPIFACASNGTHREALEMLRGVIEARDFIVLRGTLETLEAMYEKKDGGAQWH